MNMHLHTPATVLGAGGLIQTGMNLTGQLDTLIKAAAAVIIIAGIVAIGVKTRWAAGAVVVAILTGAGVMWGISHIQIISDKVGQDVSALPVVQVVQSPPALVVL